jgi:hypothetical protein
MCIENRLLSSDELVTYCVRKRAALMYVKAA